MRLLCPLLGLLLALGLPAAAGASCFDGQFPPMRWAAAAASSAVRLVLTQPDGRAFGVASGVVVARSGDAADPRNRLLTAGHVLRDVASVPGSVLAVYGSDGALLGTARAAAAAAPGPAFGLRDRAAPSGLRFGDIAVLRMQAFAPGGAGRFAAIPGLRLAPAQSAGLLRGDVADPAGVDPGVSGAGVLGRDGRLLGIMAAKLDDPSVQQVSVLAGDPSGLGGVVLNLPLHAIGYATPIADPLILAALGRAGAQVRQARAPLRPSVLIPGYPRGACVVFRAVMGPA